MRWTIFGHNPLWLAIAWFIVSIVALIVVMNAAASVPVIVARWIFAIATLYSVSDLSVRINRFRWK